MHNDPHPMKDQWVTLVNAKDPSRSMVVEGAKAYVIDWWDRLSDKSWFEEKDSNFACHWYMDRLHQTKLPFDSEAVYVKIPAANGIDLGHLVHASELEDGWAPRISVRAAAITVPEFTQWVIQRHGPQPEEWSMSEYEAFVAEYKKEVLGDG